MLASEVWGRAGDGAGCAGCFRLPEGAALAWLACVVPSRGTVCWAAAWRTFFFCRREAGCNCRYLLVAIARGHLEFSGDGVNNGTHAHRTRHANALARKTQTRLPRPCESSSRHHGNHRHFVPAITKYISDQI